MNQSDTVISDIDLAPSSIFAEYKKRSKRKNSGCSLPTNPLLNKNRKHIPPNVFKIFKPSQLPNSI
jgi:hypothetical protein